MYGNMMHQIFSRIKFHEDLGRVLDALQKEGQVPGKERDELESMIRKKLNTPVVHNWFSEGRMKQVFNERSILCGDGSVLRPDRVIVEGERLTVVDFKFGELEKPGYVSQVRSYMDRLRQMGYRQVDGYLWYVILDKTVKI
jgi:hypothetical protein